MFRRFGIGIRGEMYPARLLTGLFCLLGSGARPRIYTKTDYWTLALCLARARCVSD